MNGNSDEVPYITPPEELDDDPDKNGLICFLNTDRQCGADCMAYTTIASESPYLNEQQKHCVLIVGAERLGRHSGGILSLLKKTDADSKRAAASPLDPRGGG
jgi:hypothetical protein